MAAAAAASARPWRFDPQLALALRRWVRGQEQSWTNLHVEHLEREFDFRWEANPHDGTDPLLARRLEARLELALADTLRALDGVLSHMPGLSPPHRPPSETARADGERTVTQLWHRLRRAYAHPRPIGTEPTFAEAAKAAYIEIAAEWVPQARERLRAQADTTRALQRLCAAVLEHRDVAAQVHEDAQLLRDLVDMAPQQLQSELHESDAPFDELVDLLNGETVPGGSGAACLPASLNVRTRGVVEWAARHALPAQQACLTTLATLSRLRNAPDAAEDRKSVV